MAAGSEISQGGMRFLVVAAGTPTGSVQLFSSEPTGDTRHAESMLSQIYDWTPPHQGGVCLDHMVITELEE